MNKFRLKWGCETIILAHRIGNNLLGQPVMWLGIKIKGRQ